MSATRVRFANSFAGARFLEISVRTDAYSNSTLQQLKSSSRAVVTVADYALKVLIVQAARRLHGERATEPDIIVFSASSASENDVVDGLPDSESVQLSREICRAILRVPDQAEAARLRAALTLVSEIGGRPGRIDVLRTSGALLHLVEGSKSWD